MTGELRIEHWQDIVPNHVTAVATIVVAGIVQERKPQLGGDQADVLARQAKEGSRPAPAPGRHATQPCGAGAA